jgi:2-succinyl-6-hydroxy-2,4-cyclohexadiene-1-carboxylate synthase
VTARALHFERRGDGPPLVLLHGFTGSARSMAGVAAALEHEYQTIAPDLPGHGRSVGGAAAGGYRFDDCIDVLAATLHAAGHERAHWLGYSMGARLALACAVRHPERVASLVLLAGRAGIAAADERDARRAADEAFAARLEACGIDEFVDEWLAQPLFATLQRFGPGFMAEERRARLANDPRELAASLRALGPAAQPPLFAALPRVEVPVLLVAGALDTRFVAAAHDLARRVPRAEVQEIADAGHAAHLERPAAFVAAVREFLRRATGPVRPPSTSSVQEIAS